MTLIDKLESLEGKSARFKYKNGKTDKGFILKVNRVNNTVKYLHVRGEAELRKAKANKLLEKDVLDNPKNYYIDSIELIDSVS